jgi:4-diphosphocytidyl-2-C-methyl-D-erythritol kinase
MYCFDKGDQFADIEINIKGKYVVLVYPNLHISTAEAYSGVKPQQPKTDLIEALKLPLSDWKNYVVNDFETGLFEKYPVLPQIKNQLYEQGAAYASMTGSGSTLFGIFESEPQLANNYADYVVWKGRV